MPEQTSSSGQTLLNVPKMPPGALIGVEVSYKEALEFTESEKTAIRELCRKFQLRDMPARREEVIRVWERRLFDRGFQHLLPTYSGNAITGWQLPTVGSGYGPGEPDSRSIFETNIYNAYGQIIISALTREVPTPRFRPRDRQNDADITAAEKADKIRKEIEFRNKMIALQAEMARFLYTDGRAIYFSRYMKDGSRFGYEDKEQEELEEETVPEDEEKISEQERATGEGMPEGDTGIRPTGDEVDTAEEEESKPQREPRGREVIEVIGALESKLPIKSDCLAECPYAQVSREIDLQVARARYPDVADNVKPWSGGPGGDDIDRLARINTRLGVLDNYITTDSAAYDVTEQITWLRTAALLEVPTEEERNSLIKKAGESGLRVIFCGETFCEGRALSMDEQLSLCHALPGDGMHRPGLGDWLIPIQKVYNNDMELADDYLVRGVPAKWMDNTTFNPQKMAEQTNSVGATYGFDAPEDGRGVDQLIFQETAISFPAQLFEMIQYIQGPLAQLLCGATDAMFGGDSAPDDASGVALSIKRDLALGRIGLPWRAIKECVAQVFQQAITCLARNEEDGHIDLEEDEESVRIEMSDLNGEFMAYCEVDENFPESPTQRANRFALVMQDAATNPFLQQLMDSPDNMELIKDGAGLEDLVLPILEAKNKQLGENVILLKGGPLKNPKIGQMKQQIALMVASGDPSQIQQAQQLAPQLQQLPPLVSSVELGYFDDHATELATCVKVLNSPRGRALRNGDEEDQAAYQNLLLHAQEHEQALKAKQAGQPPQGAKPPSISIALKDLPPAEAAQAAQKAGLQSKPQDFQQEEAVEAVTKHPGSIVQ